MQGNSGRAALFPSSAATAKISNKGSGSPYSSDSNYSSSFSPRVQRAARPARLSGLSAEVPKSLNASKEQL